MDIVDVLRAEGTPVRAVVRPTADSAKREHIASLGVEMVGADLKDPASLRDACQGVDVVISTASASLSRQEGDSVETVDGQGQLALVDAAAKARVRHFVFLSFAPIAQDCGLQRAKRAVEARLQQGNMAFAILHPAPFFEVWLSPVLGFAPAHGRARILGTGQRPVSWISKHDVARLAALAAAGGPFEGKVTPLGGPEALSTQQVLEIFEELGAPKASLEHIPESVLEDQLARATNSIEEALAAFMLHVARGLVVDSRPAQELLKAPLATVRDHARSALSIS